MLVRVCDKCGDQNPEECVLVGGIGVDLCVRCQELLAHESDVMHDLWKGIQGPFRQWLLKVPMPEPDDLENAAQRMWRDWEKVVN